jgi:hypothetical protein
MLCKNDILKLIFLNTIIKNISKSECMKLLEIMQ